MCESSGCEKNGTRSWLKCLLQQRVISSSGRERASSTASSTGPSDPSAGPGDEAAAPEAASSVSPGEAGGLSAEEAERLERQQRKERRLQQHRRLSARRRSGQDQNLEAGSTKDPASMVVLNETPLPSLLAPEVRAPEGDQENGSGDANFQVLDLVLLELSKDLWDLSRPDAVDLMAPLERFPRLYTLWCKGLEIHTQDVTLNGPRGLSVKPPAARFFEEFAARVEQRLRTLQTKSLPPKPLGNPESGPVEVIPTTSYRRESNGGMTAYVASTSPASAADKVPAPTGSSLKARRGSLGQTPKARELELTVGAAWLFQWVDGKRAVQALDLWKGVVQSRRVKLQEMTATVTGKLGEPTRPGNSAATPEKDAKPEAPSASPFAFFADISGAADEASPTGNSAPEAVLAVKEEEESEVRGVLSVARAELAVALHALADCLVQISNLEEGKALVLQRRQSTVEADVSSTTISEGQGEDEDGEEPEARGGVTSLQGGGKVVGEVGADAMVAKMRKRKDALRSEAEAALTEALEMNEQAFGPNHTRVAKVCLALAVFHFDRHDLRSCEKLCRRAVKVLDVSVSAVMVDGQVENSSAETAAVPLLAGALTQHAEVLTAQGRFRRALPLQQRALALDEAAMDNAFTEQLTRSLMDQQDPAAGEHNDDSAAVEAGEAANIAEIQGLTRRVIQDLRRISEIQRLVRGLPACSPVLSLVFLGCNVRTEPYDERNYHNIQSELS